MWLFIYNTTKRYISNSKLVNTPTLAFRLLITMRDRERVCVSLAKHTDRDSSGFSSNLSHLPTILSFTSSST